MCIRDRPDTNNGNGTIDVISVNNIIEVVVNLMGKSIIWNVNGVYHSSYKNVEMFADRSRMFLPCV